MTGRMKLELHGIATIADQDFTSKAIRKVFPNAACCFPTSTRSEHLRITVHNPEKPIPELETILRASVAGHKKVTVTEAGKSAT